MSLFVNMHLDERFVRAVERGAEALERMSHPGESAMMQIVWDALAPYIASEDPPDSGSYELDYNKLTQEVLPRMWDDLLRATHARP